MDVQLWLWSSTFGAQPRAWGLIVGVLFEAAIGTLALSATSVVGRSD